MVIVLGSIVAQEKHLAEALALSLEHVRRSRAEPGCISHAVHQDTENPLRLVFVEQWASQEALWAHFKVPASRGFVKAVASLAKEAPSMALYAATPVEPPRTNAL
jgi:quinol monooxygenase YgiN